MPIAGQLISGGIRLVRLIGHGSHSLVYYAVNADGQPCAVKVFHPQMASFADREFQHARDLSHPRLTRLLGRASVDDQPALIATLARGEVLFQRYQQRPTLHHERQAFLLTLRHTLEALAYLHCQGLVHRDIKPENILVETDGTATLVDFDLSGPAREAFAAPLRLGTAAFQSPEAARGEPLGPESDLYGLGVLLGWAIHGFLPDEGEVFPPSGDPLGTLQRAMTSADRHSRLADARVVIAELERLDG